LRLRPTVVPFRPTLAIARAVAGLGRSEDVQFSPNGRALAIAGFSRNTILVIQIDARFHPTWSVEAGYGVEILCKNFRAPHGIAWLDNETLAVANREAGMVIVPVPHSTATAERAQVAPLLLLGPGESSCIETPGCIAASALGNGFYDLFVCNTYSNHISRHVIRRGATVQAFASVKFLQSGLNIPDGLALTKSRELIAVSNHYERQVVVFRNDERNRTLRAEHTFDVPGYPHGLRFAHDDKLLLVADAGQPNVHVFARGAVGWTSAVRPHASVEVMDDETFQRGRGKLEEGGPKGVDVAPDGSLMVVTCETAPIAFFKFSGIRDLLSPVPSLRTAAQGACGAQGEERWAGTSDRGALGAGSPARASHRD
jgi:hypothetical protein